MSNDEGSAVRPGMFARLKAGLARTASALTGSLTALFTKKRLDAETVQALEDALIGADAGSKLAHTLAAEVAKGRYDTEISEAEVRTLLAAAVAKVLKPAVKPFLVEAAKKPFVVLVLSLIHI